MARVWFCGVAQISLIQGPPSHKILTDKNPIIMDLHKYNFSAKSCGMEKRERERSGETLNVMMSFWPQLGPILSPSVLVTVAAGCWVCIYHLSEPQRRRRW